MRLTNLLAPLYLLLCSLAGCGPTESSGDLDGGLGTKADAVRAGRVDANPGSAVDASVVDAGVAEVADAMASGPDAAVGPGSGNDLYYYGDFATNALNQVGRLDLDSGATRILPILGLSGGADITGIAVAPVGAKLAVAGKNNTGDAPQLQIYPADGSGSPLVLFSASNSMRRISTLSFSPDGAMLAFLADGELLGSRALYVVPADASAVAKRVSLTPVASTQDVSVYAWSGDSTHLAFQGDLVSNNVEGLWTVDASAATPAPVEIVTTAELGSSDVQRGVGFDSSNRIYFRSNLELGTKSRLYRANLDGTGRIQVPGTVQTNGTGEASVGTFAISPDRMRLAWAVDAPSAGLFQVEVLDLATSTSTRVSNLTTTAPASGTLGPNLFEGMHWSPDGTKLVMAADWLNPGGSDNDFGVVLLPTSGAAGGIRLATPAVSSGDAFRPVFGINSNKIVFIGDVLVSAHNDLFRVSDLTVPDQNLVSIRVLQSISQGTIRGTAMAR